MKTTPEAADVRHWTNIALWLAAISLMPAGVSIYTALSHPGGPVKLIAAVMAVVAITASLTAFGATAKAISAGNSTDLAEEAARVRRCARIATTAFMAAAFAMVTSYLVIMAAQLLQAVK